MNRDLPARSLALPPEGEEPDEHHKQHREAEGPPPPPYRPYSWPHRRLSVVLLIVALILLLLGVAATATYWAWRAIDVDQRIERLEGKP